MGKFYLLYHLARADFLERSRRYSFLITLGLTIYAAYLYLPPSNSGYLTLGLDHYRGAYNSAWIGGAVAVLCSALLSLPAFYLVKNAIERDEQTGVGQIIATTPLTKPLYTLGKTFSNFVFLAVMVVVIALAAIAMQWIRAETIRFDPWALFSPFILSVLPAMAVIAALAALFESIPWLRGTFGNVVYLMLWLVLLLLQAADMSSLVTGSPANDLWGIQAILASMMHDTAKAFPGYQGGVAIGLTKLQAPLETFTWDGVHWTTEIILGRIVWLGAALGISLLAAVFFRRFDPAPTKRLRPREPELLKSQSFASVPPAPTPVDLTPLASMKRSFFPARILLAELRLLFKGIGWWWIIIFIGVNVAGILLPLESARQYLLPVAWIIPLGLWSSMGVREKRHNTGQLIFSAPHPLRWQFPFVWLAGVVISVVMSMGVAVHMVAAGDWFHLIAWVAGALFIPSLALALGIWSGSSKLFEVVYVLWWYVGPMNQVENLDFMGAGSNLQMSRIYLYGFLSILLLALAVVGRKKQLNW
jgi:hypothetical protein